MANRSQVYTAQALKAYPVWRAADNRHGIIVDESGNLTTEAVNRTATSVRNMVWDALGFLDVLDIDQQTLKQDTTALRQQAAQLQQQLSAARTEIAELRQTLTQSLATISSFLGVTVPNWRNKNEVENGGGDMEPYPGAAELGLIVTYTYDQRRPGYGHEEVISINPPAGALVARGSTIEVLINLQG